jgi:flagellar hook-length control protein FliK
VPELPNEAANSQGPEVAPNEEALPNVASLPAGPSANDLAATLLSARSNWPSPAPTPELPNADTNMESGHTPVQDNNQAVQDRQLANAAAPEQLAHVTRPVLPSPQNVSGDTSDETGPGTADPAMNVPEAPPAVPSGGSPTTGDSSPSNTSSRESAPGFPTPPAGQPEVPPSAGEPVESVPVRAANAMPAGGQSEVQNAGPALEPQSLESQIVHALRMQWRGRVGEARLTLHPKYLGAVAISLRVEQGGMTAIMQVEDPQVRAWIQGNEALLKQGLASHGLTLERLVVSEEQTRRDRQGEHEGEARRDHSRHGRRWLTENAPRFEITA